MALESCEVVTSSERAPTDPKVFTKIHMQFNIRGRGLKANLVERAVMLSHTKYCSATKMLGLTAEITHDYRLIEL
jgi:putative redox protein